MSRRHHVGNRTFAPAISKIGNGTFAHAPIKNITKLAGKSCIKAIIALGKKEADHNHKCCLYQVPVKVCPNLQCPDDSSATPNSLQHVTALVKLVTSVTDSGDVECHLNIAEANECGMMGMISHINIQSCNSAFAPSSFSPF